MSARVRCTPTPRRLSRASHPWEGSLSPGEPSARCPAPCILLRGAPSIRAVRSRPPSAPVYARHLRRLIRPDESLAACFEGNVHAGIPGRSFLPPVGNHANAMRDRIGARTVLLSCRHPVESGMMALERKGRDSHGIDPLEAYFRALRPSEDLRVGISLFFPRLGPRTLVRVEQHLGSSPLASLFVVPAPCLVIPAKAGIQTTASRSATPRPNAPRFSTRCPKA